MTPSLSHTADHTPLAEPDARDGREQHCQQLRAHLADNPRNETAWPWLSEVADQPVLVAEGLVRELEFRAARPIGSKALARRLRRLADTVERAPRGPHARLQDALTWAGRILLAGVLIVIALVIGPLALGNRPIIIISGSMEPVIHTGSIVIAESVTSAGLRVGEVIAYMPGANAAIPIVHRIVSLRDEDGTRYYITRGDANPANDPTEFPLGATAWRYRYSVPVIGYIVVFAAGPNGKLIMIGLPILGLVAMSGIDWLKRRRESLPGPLLQPAPMRPSLAPKLQRLRALCASLQKAAWPRWLQLAVWPTRLRLSLAPKLQRLRAHSASMQEAAWRRWLQRAAWPTRLRLSLAPKLQRLHALSASLQEAAWPRWLQLAAWPTRLRLFAQPLLQELDALPELLTLLRLRALLGLRALAGLLRKSNQAMLLRPSYLRAQRELRELRALLRLPPRSAQRELRTLLRVSVLCELRALLRLPAVVHLGARLRRL